MPRSMCDRVKYIILFPHTLVQYIMIPNPMVEGREEYYPLTLLMATFWIWVYSFFIVFLTYEITIAYDLHFSILPMIIFPFGIVLRDLKKLEDMKICVETFKVHCSD
jgi:hypothetical protein